MNAEQRSLAKLYDKIQPAHDAVEEAEHAFLRAAGWTYTSELAALWLWKRGENPAVYVNTASAIHISTMELFG